VKASDRLGLVCNYRATIDELAATRNTYAEYDTEHNWTVRKKQFI
jgi:hypothetical protein